ncbi:MAG: TIGR02281 family clan AA aspartic protease [Gammaproteobacteria bacterium]
MLSISTEQATLYLGKEFVTPTRDGNIPGWIDDMIIGVNGTTSFIAKVSQPVIATNFPLIEKETSLLLGILTNKTSEPLTHEALDINQIRKLLDGQKTFSPLSVSAFADYYASTTQGIIEKINSLSESGKLDKAKRLARELLTRNLTINEQDHINNLLRSLYHKMVKRSLLNNQVKLALQYLDEALCLFDRDSELYILKAEAARKSDQLEAARRHLHKAIELEPGLVESIYPHIRQLVIALARGRNKTLSNQDIIQILEKEIPNDPLFPDYRHLLGKLHFEQGSYNDAMISLAYAIQLDGSLDEALSPLIESAEHRINNPAYIEIPLIRHGSVFSVNASINNQPDTYAFILDTGATYTAISEETLNRSGLNIPFGASEITMNTANGPVIAPVLQMDTITLAGASVKNIDVTIVNDLESFDGLLGLSFLEQFNFRVDQDKNLLILTQKK